MLPSEFTNAVGLRPAVKGEAEGDVERHAVVVGQREPGAESRAERAIDPRHVVAAGAVAREAQAEVAQVVGVRRLDEVALVLDDGDLADVDGAAAGGERSRTGDAVGAGPVEPERVEQPPARVAVDSLGLPRGELVGRCRRADGWSS